MKTEAVKWVYCLGVAHVRVSLHVVHVNVAVSRRATSVVLGVGARTARMLSVPQLHKVCRVYTQQQEFDELGDAQEKERVYLSRRGC